MVTWVSMANTTIGDGSLTHVYHEDGLLNVLT
jgi:hypothetical protein